MNSSAYIQTLHLALLHKSGSFVRVCDLLRTEQTFLQLVTQKKQTARENGQSEAALPSKQESERNQQEQRSFYRLVNKVVVKQVG